MTERSSQPTDAGTMSAAPVGLAGGDGESSVDLDGIMALLPHRYPFLLVDRILSVEPDVRIVGIKNVSGNEPFFAGHFPGNLVMPGLLIVEALAQVGAFLLMRTLEGAPKKLAYFTSLHDVTWSGAVVPGDQLQLEVTVTQRRGRLHKVHGIALVRGAVVCAADLGAMVMDR